jgi:hypothetical protein
MLETIDPRDVKAVLTEEQLRRGADGIAYRAEQLTHVVRVGDFAARNAASGKAIQNALVESALVNGRALAYFLTAAKHNDDDLHVSHYSKTIWRDGSKKITKVAEKIIDAASHHLAHSVIGSDDWEPHPGDWPLREMAVVLGGELSDFVETLATKHLDRAMLFGSTPTDDYFALMTTRPLDRPTPVSDHPMIGDLTRSLQDHLGIGQDRARATRIAPSARNDPSSS